ncbi:MAG: thioredoxin family protein [Actinomycetia bacterium]|nr:thioredoxin family protein [Actinomycetes bacterium]MCP3912357.1 thioredoxin family protein [Actinomycetes bacterium]MCP4084071.1 thioredoxin family protein [Actinomycetes bacterium]
MTDPATTPGFPTLPDGFVAVVKRDCPTCELVAPALGELQQTSGVTVYSQDDPGFPGGLAVIDDRDLSVSWHHDIETVPTLIRAENGAEVERIVGWDRDRWRAFTAHTTLGEDLSEYSPGCGSLSVDPSLVDELRVRFGGSSVRGRRVEIAELEDEFESMFERGWSDGLPLVPPTEARVTRMLEGTTRAPGDVVAVVPPDLVECTVEKVAVNAVMAGCRPEYLPVVIGAVEAACTDQFNMHGLLATTMPMGPVLIVNGPIRQAIGMNSGGNVFGQGNRANLTIGRALQLVVRNIGGGRPGEVDRAAHGGPGKVSFCFAEDEEGSPWEPLATDFGVDPGVDAVTLFPGESPKVIVDQLSRQPESLTRTLAMSLRAMHHPKLVRGFDVLLAIGPEHSRIYREAGWTKEQLVDRLHELLVLDGDEMIRGAAGIAEGVPEIMAGTPIPKFRPEGIRIVHCGGGAGLFSVMIGGWVNGPVGSDPVCQPITP